MRPLRSAPLLVTAFALVAGSAGADLLVTRDGATVETKGPWKVEGRRIVFSLPNGVLSSMRTEMVDLDRSAVATARAAEEAVAAASPAPAASSDTVVMRITEKDIPPMTVSEDEAEEGAASETSTRGSVPLEVVSWDKIPTDDGEGIQVFGTLRNAGRNTVVAPGLTVQLYGEDGGLLALTEASVNQTSIPPGESANFRASFPGLPDFTAAKFSVAGRGYETTQATGDQVELGGSEPVTADEDFEANVEPEPSFDAPAEAPEPESVEPDTAAEPPPA